MSEPSRPPPTAPRVVLIEPGLPPGAPSRPSRPLRGGSVTVTCELRTPRVQRTYRRDFTPLGHWLQGLERARHIDGIPPGAVDQAQATIVLQLAALRAEFELSVQQSDILLSAQGLGHLPIRYASALTVAAPIVHPIARVYLDTLSAADDAFAAAERAWLMGVLDTRDRRLQEARLRKSLHRATAAVRQQYSEMARRLREARGALADGRPDDGDDPIDRAPPEPDAPGGQPLGMAVAPEARTGGPGQSLAPTDRMAVAPWWSGGHAGGPFSA